MIIHRSGLLYYVAIAMGVAALGLAGCSHKGREAAVKSDAAPDSGKPISYPATDYTERSQGRPGGTLHVSSSTDTSNLDPHAVSSAYVEWLGRLLFDNLVYLDAKGNITPWLAKSWTISPDGKTYTFHLRDDVTFSDGSKFNAEAVRINLEHMRDPATKSPLAAAYIAPYIDGKVIDDYTFEAHLRTPYTPFLEVLAQSWLAIISPKQILEHPDQIAQHPIGSGPFVLESYTPQQSLRFVKRAEYHWAPGVINHEGPAYLDRIDIDFLPEAMVRYSSLASGQYDLTLEAPPQNAAAIRSDPSLVFDNRIRMGIPTRAITFNTEAEPFTDARVRKAFALAVDREGIARLIGFGEYQPKADFLAANTRYYDPAYRHVLDYNVPEANRLLDEAGWTGRDPEGYRTKGGKRLSAEILVTQALTPGPMAVEIQSDVKKIGFELKIVELPIGELLARRNSGNYQATTGGVWHTNTPDALYIVFDSNQITSSKRIGQNSARLRDPVLDDLLERARESLDPAVLQGLYSQAQKRVVDDVPAVSLYDNYTSTSWHDYVKGVIFDTSHNTPVFTGAWLDKEGQ